MFFRNERADRLFQTILSRSQTAQKQLTDLQKRFAGLDQSKYLVPLAEAKNNIDQLNANILAMQEVNRKFTALLRKQQAAEMEFFQKSRELMTDD